MRQRILIFVLAVAVPLGSMACCCTGRNSESPTSEKHVPVCKHCCQPGSSETPQPTEKRCACHDFRHVMTDQHDRPAVTWDGLQVLEKLTSLSFDFERQTAEAMLLSDVGRHLAVQSLRPEVNRLIILCVARC